MEPLEIALKNYRELSPIDYLQRTHDARIYDIAFDGETLVLVSESWVSMALEASDFQSFRPIFSRYRATFRDIRNFQLEALEPEEYPGPPTLADFMQREVTDLKIALPNVTIGTDDHEIRFSCQRFDVKRFAPTTENCE